MTTLKELLEQRDELDKQIQETSGKQRTEAIQKVRGLMDDYGLTVADLAMPRASKRAPGSVSKVAVKYRNTATGETWSGRGLQPKWLKAAIAGGAALVDFHV